jgi:uncharacterized protein involved in exopolysaccharide biosynthesis
VEKSIVRLPPNTPYGDHGIYVESALAVRNRPSSSPYSVGEIVGIVWRHKTICAAWTLFVGAVAAGLLFLMPKTYRSEAKLYVRLGRESVSLDPSATTGQTVQVTESRENQINSARDMLTSTVLLEKVVDKFGADAILNGPAKPATSSSKWSASIKQIKSLIPSIRLSPPVSPRERAVRDLQNTLQIKLPRQSSVMTISLKAQTPQFAQQLLDRYLLEFQQQYITAHRTSGSHQFFAEQAKLLKAQLDEADARLRDAKNVSGVVSIADEQKSLQAQRTQLEAAQLAAAAALSGSEGTLASLKQAIANSAEQLESQRVSGVSNTAGDLMQQELYRLRIQMEEAKSKYNESHPLIAQLKQQMAEAEAVVALQPVTRVQITQAVNPSRTALELDYKREEAAAAAHRARSETLTEQLQALRLRLERLNEEEIRMAQLSREAELAAANYLAYTKNLEQVRIDQALADNRISPVNVVQPPSLVEKPASPRPAIVLSVAAVAALGGALGLAFAREMFSSALRAPGDVEAQLGLPVLVSIPRLRATQMVVQN